MVTVVQQHDQILLSFDAFGSNGFQHCKLVDFSLISAVETREYGVEVIILTCFDAFLSLELVGYFVVDARCGLSEEVEPEVMT